MVSADRLDQLDYYTLLGLEPDASTDHVRTKFHEFALKFHPDRHAEADDSKRLRAAQIYRRGTEAYRVLCDPQRRREYDQQLSQGRLRYDPGDKAPSGAMTAGARGTAGAAAIGAQTAKARPFFAKAQQALRSGDLKTARLNMRIALSHEPNNEHLKAMLKDIESKLSA